MSHPRFPRFPLNIAEIDLLYAQTRSWSKKLAILLPGLRYALTFVGIIAALSHSSIHKGWLNELLTFAWLFGGALVAAAVVSFVPTHLRDTPKALRVFKTGILAALIGAVPILIRRFSLFTIAHFCLAAGYACAALIRVPFVLGYMPRAATYACKAYDYLCGGLLIGACMLLSLAGFMKHVQNRALLSDAFNQGIQYAELSRLLPSD